MTAAVGPPIDLATMDALDAIKTFCGARPRPGTYIYLRGSSCALTYDRTDPFSAMHGIIGVIRGGNIITSPNATWIPDVQLQHSSVGLCKDMRFGRDDYCLFPQWYHDEYPYLAAIPKQPMDGDSSPFSSMWYTPTMDADFTLANARFANQEPGYVHLRLNAELSQLKTEICDEVIRILIESTGDQSIFPSQLSAGMTAVKHAWLILTSTAAAFDEKRLEFAEFQRSWLELKGMVDFRAWKETCARNPSQSPSAEARRSIGCFVESLPVAMLLFDMGVPVWLVRDKMTVLRGDVYIQHATTSTMAPQHFNPPICTERDVSFPVIYSSSPRQVHHYQQQHKFSRIRSTIYGRSGAEMILQSVCRDQMGRRDAMTCLVDLKTMRAQAAATALDSAACSSLSSAASSSSSAPHRAQRHAPCKFFSILKLHCTR